MSGDVHVRFCESAGVRVPRATLLIVGCASEEDARRIMKALPLRFAKYGLQINAEKTRVVRFARPRWGFDPAKHGPKPETFTFLGFTHYWGKTKKGGHTIKRKTEGKRLVRTLSAYWQWCRANRHRPLERQYRDLCAKLRGYYQYYGVRCNSDCLDLVHYTVERAWRYWLNRRGGRKMTWKRYRRLKARFPLPRPKIVRAWV